ncbi:hypothetical protein OGAPHI_003439 [Ogataea philodendri]|uniref:Vacuolar protein sorting-associated protein 54 C-terminal domain-containing protein n=1 Tax=Ogataea philodendri TaxID=1378263 RepID=A0A9P8P6Q4_9ASCO|nr:uncharacterized protein OGAPHI_003439 [Ogataea philodendri]KAH3666583.1 hypothetical protein OGAPHI_003439 [Ogataea philodendri]
MESEARNGHNASAKHPSSSPMIGHKDRSDKNNNLDPSQNARLDVASDVENSIDPSISVDASAGIESSTGTAPSINDDLASIDQQLNTSHSSVLSRTNHRRQYSENSLFSYNARPESSVLLGVNKLSEASISPLGKNSIFELVQNLNYTKRATSSGQLSLGSSQASISLRGPTTRDIPMTQLSKISKVKSSQLKSYSDLLQNEYSKFKLNKTLTESTLEAFINQLDRGKGQESTEKFTSETNFLPSEKDEAELEQNSLINIPHVYFSQDFRLDDPRIFAEVIENCTILKSTTDFNEDGSERRLVNNHELQEKLSSYLDIIEIQLIREISKSSGSFFSALGDLNNITVKSNHLTKYLGKLDSDLQLVEEQQANKAMNLLDLVKRRKNAEKLEQGLLQIFTIMHQADLAESSYYNANYDKALELADSVFALIRGNNPSHFLVDNIVEKWPYPLEDLNRVSALSPLKRLLVNLVADTGKSYSKLFNDTLIVDLRNHYEQIPQMRTIERLQKNLQQQSKNSDSSTLNLEYKSIDAKFSNQLKEYMNGLARCGEMRSAFKSYEDKFSTELKSIIRSNLPGESIESTSKGSISGRSDGSKSTTAQHGGQGNLGNSVKVMTPREFEDMLLRTFSQLSEALRRLTTHRRILLEMGLDSMSAIDSNIFQKQPDLALDLDLTKSISESIDMVQRRMSKIIGVRDVQNSSVTLEYFLRFFDISAMFHVECELISSGTSKTSALQDVMAAQFSKFNVQYQKTTLKIMTQLIEKEMWKECSIPSHIQDLLNQIVESASDDFSGADWLSFHSKISPVSKTDTSANDISERKTLTIEGQSMILPEVISEVLVMIKNYEIIKLKFNSSNDTYIVDFLKLLNLKTHQAVLGAQATKTAGLKHITPKYLAVASQFVNFLALLTPYLKAFFKKHSKAQIFNEGEFDRIIGIFRDHQYEIFDKLITLMTDRMHVHSREIKLVNWSQPLPHQQAHKYMEILVKETLTIARVLQRYLPESQYTDVLSRIFEGYEQSFVDCYQNLAFRDAIEKAVVMRDIDYFREKLGEVTGYNNSGQRIWDCVNALSTEEDLRMESIMRDNIRDENVKNLASPLRASPEKPDKGLDNPINISRSKAIASSSEELQAHSEETEKSLASAPVDGHRIEENGEKEPNVLSD